MKYILDVIFYVVFCILWNLEQCPISVIPSIKKVLKMYVLKFKRKCQFGLHVLKGSCCRTCGQLQHCTTLHQVALPRP